MYVPAHFRPTEDQVRALLERPGAVDLITVTERGLLATMLPMAWDAPGSRPGLGEHGALVGHVAIKNDQWRKPPIGEAMAIVRGPDAYISPSWYEAKRKHGRVVPTWDYVLIQAHGRLVIHRDVEWLERNVRRLVELHEGQRAAPWAVDDAPADYIAGQLRAIVGVELLVDRIDAKAKLSQNRSNADLDGVVAGLDADGQRAMSDAIQADRAR